MKQRFCVGWEQSSSIEALRACPLISLDKSPGLRHILVGEVLRRIAGNIDVSIVRKDAISSVGSLQVCDSHKAGYEAAIDAMHSIFSKEETEAVLLIDASNAFNSANRNLFLQNVSVVCRAIAIYVQNVIQYHQDCSSSVALK